MPDQQESRVTLGVHDPYFGEGLGLAGGGRRTLRHAYGTEDRDLNLRLLVLARGAHDLRSPDAERSGGLPVACSRRTASPRAFPEARQ